MNPKVNETLFFVDAMLGNLARKLRLLGYDTRYSSDIPDDKLISEADKESRIIVSKDTMLVKIAEKKGIPCVLVTKDNEIDQLLEINEKVRLNPPAIGGDTTRCPACNGKLTKVTKSSVKDTVPQRILDTIEDFWRCRNCNKVYWEGTHIDNLQNFVSELNEKLR